MSYTMSCPSPANRPSCKLLPSLKGHYAETSDTELRFPVHDDSFTGMWPKPIQHRVREDAAATTIRRSAMADSAMDHATAVDSKRGMLTATNLAFTSHS